MQKTNNQSLLCVAMGHSASVRSSESSFSQVKLWNFVYIQPLRLEWLKKKNGLRKGLYSFSTFKGRERDIERHKKTVHMLTRKRLTLLLLRLPLAVAVEGAALAVGKTETLLLLPALAPGWLSH